MDWVRSFRSNQHEFFRFNRGQNCPRGRVSHEFYQPRPKAHKRTKHEFWVKWDGLGAFVSNKSTSSFYASTVARTALGGEFRMNFVNRNRKLENAPNMSFGSNGMDWVRSFRKNQHEFFSLQPWPKLPSGAGFA
jgi:hypothetical protein